MSVGLLLLFNRFPQIVGTLITERQADFFVGILMP